MNLVDVKRSGRNGRNVTAMAIGSDEPLLRACEEFFRLNKIWGDANPEANGLQSETWTREECLRVALERDGALNKLLSLAPSGVPGLIRKTEVLDELVRWKPIEDGKVVSLSLELIKDYKAVFIASVVDQGMGAPARAFGHLVGLEPGGKKRWKLNFHNFLGIFHI